MGCSDASDSKTNIYSNVIWTPSRPRAVDPQKKKKGIASNEQWMLKNVNYAVDNGEAPSITENMSPES